MAARTKPAPRGPAEGLPAAGGDAAVRSRGVSMAVWCQLTLRACSGFLTFAVAFIFRRGYHVFNAVTGAMVRRSVPTWWYGVVVGSALLGGFMGSVSGPKLRRRVREESMLTGGLVVLALAGLAAARFDDRPGLALLALCAGMADALGQLAFDAIVQRDSAAGVRGRSFARFEATFQLAWVGAALVPVIVPVATWIACLAISAAAGLTGGFYVLARRSSLRPTPSDAAIERGPRRNPHSARERTT